jgi:hypothetical protein
MIQSTTKGVDSMSVDLMYIESSEKWFYGLDMYKCIEDNCGSCVMTYAYDSASTYGLGSGSGSGSACASNALNSFHVHVM